MMGSLPIDLPSRIGREKSRVEAAIRARAPRRLQRRASQPHAVAQRGLLCRQVGYSPYRSLRRPAQGALARPDLVEDRFRHDGSRGVASAEKENIEGALHHGCLTCNTPHRVRKRLKPLARNRTSHGPRALLARHCRSPSRCSRRWCGTSPRRCRSGRRSMISLTWR